MALDVDAFGIGSNQETPHPILYGGIFLDFVGDALQEGDIVCAQSIIIP